MISHEDFQHMWWNDQLKEVDDEIDDSWRHGNRHTTVFQVLDCDCNLLNQYYRAYYNVSGDGEYHGIRELEFTIEEVVPYTKTVVLTKYRKIENEK